jgi:hypothetical protein
LSFDVVGSPKNPETSMSRTTLDSVSFKSLPIGAAFTFPRREFSTNLGVCRKTSARKYVYKNSINQDVEYSVGSINVEVIPESPTIIQAGLQFMEYLRTEKKDEVSFSDTYGMIFSKNGDQSFMVNLHLRDGWAYGVKVFFMNDREYIQVELDSCDPYSTIKLPINTAPETILRIAELNK